jgi:hypothetical protein
MGVGSDNSDQSTHTGYIIRRMGAGEAGRWHPAPPHELRHHADGDERAPERTAVAVITPTHAVISVTASVHLVGVGLRTSSTLAGHHSWSRCRCVARLQGVRPAPPDCLFAITRTPIVAGTPIRHTVRDDLNHSMLGSAGQSLARNLAREVSRTEVHEGAWRAIFRGSPEKAKEDRRIRRSANGRSPISQAECRRFKPGHPLLWRNGLVSWLRSQIALAPGRMSSIIAVLTRPESARGEGLLTACAWGAGVITRKLRAPQHATVQLQHERVCFTARTS